MDHLWCENIKIVQDGLTPWSSTDFIFLIALGSFGCLILLISVFYTKWDKGVWTGFIIIFLCTFATGRKNVKTESRADILMSDQTLDFIGEVTSMEVEIEFNRNNGVSPYSGTSGPIKFDAIQSKKYFGSFETKMQINTPRGHTLSRFSPSRFDAIWFKVGDQLVKSEVGDVGINLDNECDGRNCGLRVGDRVRVSANTTRIDKRAHNSKLEDYYTEILRIERCDDALLAAGSR